VIYGEITGNILDNSHVVYSHQSHNSGVMEHIMGLMATYL